MDDLKEHAMRRAGILSMSSAWGHDDDAALLNQLIVRIAELEAQLAMRDAAIQMALKCTPSVRNGQIIYDCGNPWEILSTFDTGATRND